MTKIFLPDRVAQIERYFAKNQFLCEDDYAWLLQEIKRLRRTYEPDREAGIEVP
jgi:hypothetical protein